MSKAKTGKKLIITGVIFVLSALSIYIHNQVMDNNARSFTDKVMYNIDEYIHHQKRQSDAITYTLPLNEEEKNYIQSDQICYKYQNYAFTGYISIPKLDLELPVMYDWSYDNLNICPCRYYGSVLTDDLVIAAHNYKSHFGNINDLINGDEVFYTDITGNSYEYEVSFVEILNPAETDKMTSGEYDLTLFTCTWSGSERIVVRCEKNNSDGV